MRILVVTQYFWPERFRVNDLTTELSRRGHEVTVLTGQPVYPTKDAIPPALRRRPWTDELDGVRIVRVPLVSRGRGESWRYALNYLSFATTASALGPLRLRRAGFDVVFVFQMSPVTMAVPAVVMSRRAGAPLTMWVQDLWPETLAASGAVRTPAVLRGLDRLVHWIYRHCDHVFTQSPAFFDHVARAGLPAERMSYLPNWAEETYAPVDVPPEAPERALMPAGFTVLFAGNIGTAQAVHTVLDAAQRLRAHSDISWVFLGDGQLLPWLQQQVRDRGLTGTVSVLGRHPVETMPTFFALADAMLVTLKRDPVFALTVPSRLQSYLACARPVVGALDGVGSDVIRAAGAGYAGPAEDGAGLAASVLRMYRATPAQRGAMGAAGRAYFLGQFERGLLLDELEQRLRAVAAGARGLAGRGEPGGSDEAPGAREGAAAGATSRP